MNINLEQSEWNAILYVLMNGSGNGITQAMTGPITNKIAQQMQTQQPYKPPPGVDAEIYKGNSGEQRHVRGD
jgi:hypothetical protein